MNVKIETNKNTLINEDKVLDLPENTFVRVIKSPSTANEGNILIVGKSFAVPKTCLVCLNNGALWGTDLKGYMFEVLNISEIILK